MDQNLKNSATEKASHKHFFIFHEGWTVGLQFISLAVLSILPSFLNFKIIIFNSHNYYSNSFDTWIPKRPKFKQIDLEKN